MRYEYWTVRYVPDAVRDERVNVGIIAGAGHDWAVRRVGNLRRASRLGGSATVGEQFLADVDHRIDTELGEIEGLMVSTPVEVMSRGVVEDWRRRMLNLVQISEPRPVLADSAADAADLAFDLMVVDDHHEARSRSRTQVLRRLKAAFADDPQLTSHLQVMPHARVGEQSARIDLAISDGEVRQLSQVWAFDVRDLDHLETNVQAWSYVMGLLRRRDGRLDPRGRRKDRQTLTIPRNVDMQAIYRAPSTTDGERALRVAIDGWRELGVTPVDERDSQQVVEQARELLTV